jgi:hypothetical protein
LLISQEMKVPLITKNKWSVGKNTFTDKKKTGTIVIPLIGLQSYYKVI